MNFRLSFYDPLNIEIIQLGYFQQDKVIEEFDKIPWKEHLNKMKTANDDEIKYSPSFEIENKQTKNILILSAMDDTEWYIYYWRPRITKKFFGFFRYIKNDFMTDVTGQTENDARACLNALINNDLMFLEKKIK